MFKTKSPTKPRTKATKAHVARRAPHKNRHTCRTHTTSHKTFVTESSNANQVTSTTAITDEPDLTPDQRLAWQQNKLRPVIAHTIHQLLIQYGAIPKPRRSTFSSVENEIFAGLLSHQLLVPNDTPEHPMAEEFAANHHSHLLTGILQALSQLAIIPPNAATACRPGVIPNIPFIPGKFATDTYDLSAVQKDQGKDNSQTIVDLFAMVLTCSGYADLTQEAHSSIQYPPSGEDHTTPFTTNAITLRHFSLQEPHPLTDHLKAELIPQLDDMTVASQLIDDFFRNDISEQFHVMFGPQFAQQKELLHSYVIAQAAQTLLQERYLFADGETIYPHVFAGEMTFDETDETQADMTEAELKQKVTQNRVDGEEHISAKIRELSEEFEANKDFSEEKQYEIYKKQQFAQRANLLQNEPKWSLIGADVPLSANIYALDLSQPDILKTQPHLSRAISYQQELVQNFLNAEKDNDVDAYIEQLCGEIVKYFRTDVISYYNDKHAPLLNKIASHQVPQFDDAEIKVVNDLLSDLFVQNLSDTVFKFEYMKVKMNKEGDVNAIPYHHIFAKKSDAQHLSQQCYDLIKQQCETMFDKHH